MSIICWPLRRPAAALAVAALLASLAGCSGQVAVASPPTHAAPASAVSESPDPDMVMVNLDDLGFHTSTISMTARQPVMLMVVNRGKNPHEFFVNMRVGQLQVALPAHDAGAITEANANAVDITVAPGQEVDAAFVPQAAGSFALTADKVPAGYVVVAE